MELVGKVVLAAVAACRAARDMLAELRMIAALKAFRVAADMRFLQAGVLVLEEEQAKQANTERILQRMEMTVGMA